MCQGCEALTKAIDRYIAKADENLSDALKKEGFVDPSESVNFIESMEDGLEEALTGETDYIVSQTKKFTSLKDFKKRWEMIKAGDKTAKAITSVTRGEFQEMMPRLIDSYIQQTERGLRLVQITKRTTEWVHSWSKELGQIMQLDSHTELERILTEGLESGQGIAEFTRQIYESGIRDDYYRARRVAVTEVLRAHSVAQQEAFDQSPSVSQKMWRHSGDWLITPRPNHQDMDGQRVDKRSPYTLVGADGEIYYPMYPRDISLPPGESINCHCVSDPVVDESILGLSIEARKELQMRAIEEMDDDWERELNERNKWRNVPEEDRV